MFVNLTEETLESGTQIRKSVEFLDNGVCLTAVKVSQETKQTENHGWCFNWTKEVGSYDDWQIREDVEAACQEVGIDPCDLPWYKGEEA